MSFAHFNSRRSKRTPAYFFLQINQSSLLKLLSMESGHPNYPRVKKIFLQKWNRKRKRVGKRICLIPKQLSIYLNPTLPPTIYLLLSESYGSALAGKADLSFQLWNTNCIWLAVAEGLKTGNHGEKAGNHGKRSYTIWVSCGCFTLQNRSPPVTM